MKINTKQCSPIKKGAPEEAMLHPNKYIPPTMSKQDDKATAMMPSSNNEDDMTANLGREQKYLATISFTPVLTSKRTPDRRLLDEAEVNKLNQKLAVFFWIPTKKKKRRKTTSQRRTETRATTSSRDEYTRLASLVKS
jgi:hypothetical protein